MTGPVSGEVRVAGPVSRAAFVGSLDLKPATLRLGRAFQKPAGEEARITAQGQRENAGVRVAKFTVAFRDTMLEGTVDLPDVTVPRISFTASSARLNIDRLLAVQAKQAWQGSGVVWAATPRQEPSATALPGLSAQGRVSIGELIYQGVAWSAVTADVQYQGGVLRSIDPGEHQIQHDQVWWVVARQGQPTLSIAAVST